MKRWIFLPLLCASLCCQAQSANRQLLSTRGFMEEDGYFLPLEPGSDSVATEFRYLNADSTITKELRSIYGNRLLRREIFKKKIPVGTWFHQYDSTIAPIETVYAIDPSGALSSCSSGYLYQLGSSSLSFGGNGASFEPPVLQGDQDLNEFLKVNLHYPKSAQEAGIHGRVRIQGNLSAEGKLTDLAITKSLSGDVDAEVIRVIKLLRFERPGMVNGKAVPLCVSLPVSFEIQ